MKHKIVFFGSGPVAAASLDNLYNNYDVEMVITKNRPPHHKDPAPVEVFAQNNGLQIKFADTKNELEEIIIPLKLSSNCGIVIDYGVIISSKVINYFDKGIVNSHFSLLPEWRGADPISFALLSGQTKTGVCLMTIDEGMDTGAIIASQSINIDTKDTGLELTEKLVKLSDSLINTKLPEYILDNLKPLPQPNKLVTYSIKLQKQDGKLDWQKPATVLEREVRTYKDWPKSRCKFGDIDLTITNAISSDIILDEGKILITDDKKIFIGCGVGSLQILELKPAGKNNMNISAFLNGYANQITN